jgi:precorrin-2 dehydrogenase/sirohydrochlorin ferrochelatase
VPALPLERPQYPVNLIVDGRACLVVGGGRVATNKASGLVACGAVVTVVAPDVDAGISALEADGALRVERRRYRAGEAAAFALVVVATGDPEVSRAVSEDAEAAGRWVNVADNPALSSFTLPSVLRRGPLAIAVSTGGRSPALAAWLRRRLEAEIGDDYRVLLELVSEEREAIKASGRSPEGVDWQGALDSNMLELITAGQTGKARERLQAWLSSSLD